LTPRLRRGLFIGAAILVFVVLAGATYQGVATALERREFRHPGGLVSVGDHQLHIYCTGDGSPTVILEAPAAGLSAAWAEVQSRVAETTRVCSYDRAGLGWSEAGDRPYAPARVPEELRALLVASKQRGPFVIAGHGLGAAFARLYASRPDSDVAGLVIIGAPANGSGGGDGTGAWIMPMAPWLARAGLLRAGRILSSRADGIEGRSGGAMRAFLNRPDHLTRANAELARWDDAVRMSAGTSLRSDVPAVTVDVDADDRVAFLTDAADVTRVVDAIGQVVRTSRGSSKAR
jgi:pimeloyl-ACP methyl ester carboxylesterase